MSDIKLSDIRITAWNPRKNFNEEELAELQASIEQYGILEPLIVRPANNSYELVAGERRYRAAANIGVETVPVVIKDLTDAEVHEIMLIENLQRSSLEPLEEAQSLQVILSQGKVTQGELAARLGKTQPWVANRIRLLQAPEELKAFLISREITSKHVIAALPYSSYPIMKVITAKLQEKLEEDKHCSVTEFQEIIEDEVTRSYNNDLTLNIDDFPYSYRECEPHADCSKCDGCKHIVAFKNYKDQDQRHCLNSRCWMDLINKAQTKYESEHQKSLENMKDLEEIDLSILNSDDYQRIWDTDFDISVCDSCENRKISLQMHAPTCLDPVCYNKRKSSHSRYLNKLKKEEHERVWKAVDAWIDSKKDIDTEWVLRSLVRTGNHHRVKFGVSRWSELRSSYGDEFEAFMSNVNQDDVLSMCIRILCSELLQQYDHVDLSTLNSLVPAAAEFYIPPEASE